MMVAPHFEEYALRLCLALAGQAQVLLATDLDRLDRDYRGRARPSTDALVLRDARFRSPADGVRLLLDVARFRPHVLHLQEASGLRKAMICAAVVALVKPFCRIVLTVHDPSPHEGRDAAIAQRLDRYRRYVRRAAAVVLVHGDHCRRAYQAVRDDADQPVTAIDHGVILADTPPPPRVAERPLSVLCFGRMEAYKGLYVFLDALNLLDARGIRPDVLVAGTGPELDRLEPAFARLPHVRVENAFVASSRLIDAMREADVVVMPYLAATQSGVLAAALGNGRFVVASRVGGIPDIIDDGDNGLLVPPGDAPALADALQRVADDPALRERLAAGARRTAAHRLEWSGIASTTLSVY
jgi:glycosyltransferase involved in cell wall biosynthesis